jgi:hypothetical protein
MWTRFPAPTGDPGGPGPPGRGFGAADGIRLSITKRQVREVTPVTSSCTSTVRMWARRTLAWCSPPASAPQCHQPCPAAASGPPATACAAAPARPRARRRRGPGRSPPGRLKLTGVRRASWLLIVSAVGLAGPCAGVRAVTCPQGWLACVTPVMMVYETQPKLAWNQAGRCRARSRPSGLMGQDVLPL